MKPDWDRLIEDYKDHPTAGVYDVDCTATGKPLCEDNGVQGYPTIKYGDPTDLSDYEGGRSYDDLKDFAEKNLKPLCSPQNIDICDDEKKAHIKEYQAMEKSTLRQTIAEKDAKMAKIQRIYERDMLKLERQREKLEKKKDRKLQKVKDSGLALMKSVEAMRNSTDEAAAADARGLTWEEKAERAMKEMDAEEDD